MSKNLNAAKKRTTGNRSKRNFIWRLACDFLNARSKVLYYRAGRPRRVPDVVSEGETSHGRTPRRAEISVRCRARSRGLLVVPLRGIEEPAVLRRHAQEHRVHSGEIHHREGREAVAVRL